MVSVVALFHLTCVWGRVHPYESPLTNVILCHSLTYMCRAGAIRTDDCCIVLKVSGQDNTSSAFQFVVYEAVGYVCVCIRVSSRILSYLPSVRKLFVLYNRLQNLHYILIFMFQLYLKSVLLAELKLQCMSVTRSELTTCGVI